MKPIVKAEDRLKNKYYVIPYLPVSRQASLTIFASLIFIGLMSLWGMALSHFDIVHSVFMPISLCIASIAMSGVIAYLLLKDKLKRYVSIVVCDEGIIFPFMFKPDLLFRQSREWGDIGNIVIGSMLLQDKRGAYEYELEKNKDNRKVFIYFKSGGHAAIDLTRMSKKGMELLFVALESRYMDLSRSPQSPKELDDSRFLEKKTSGKIDEKPKSFTELWEQDMQDHFSATNFVPLEKGKLLKNGRLRILMQLACGGLSAIYLAETPDRELRVIKEATLPPTLEASLREKAKDMFTREALLLQKLSHPKIARVLDFFIEEGRDYLVLEFVPGHSLRQLVRQGGPMKEEDVLKYTLQITDIIEYLHEQNPPIIHRDITPDNLVLREDGQIVLIDFGAANEFVGTATGTLVGKQAYIAPEQFRGKAQTQSDIYALGGSLNFLLTGKDPEALSSSVPRNINPEVSPAVDALVQECTALEVAERVGSAKILHDKVELIMENGGGAVISTAGLGKESS